MNSQQYNASDNLPSSPGSFISATTPSRSGTPMGPSTLKKPPTSSVAGGKGKRARTSDTEMEATPKKRSRRGPTKEVLEYGPGPSTFSVQDAIQHTFRRAEQIKNGEFEDLETTMMRDSRKASHTQIKVTSANAMMPDQTIPQIIDHFRAVARTVDDLRTLMNTPRGRDEVLHAAATVQLLNNFAAGIQKEIDDLTVVTKDMQYPEVMAVREQIKTKETQLAHVYAQEVHGISAFMARGDIVYGNAVLIEALGRIAITDSEGVGAEVAQAFMG
ncbi:hypothetical protein EDD37DRAFT_608422 [Exophiala viscosa]|uniref:uncharacterized protein n=1 Tax=Exophiala viscosa TaxID=2486360 RepID=UPI0021939E80|nr:hypothetical protein EDD37DRAFT_608422 [Exophiala viscosa]